MVTSRTFDVEEKVMYPDRETKERTLDDVARLLTTGHTVEWRDGNRVIVLTVDKFNKILLPRFPEHSSLNIAVEEENTVIQEELLLQKLRQRMQLPYWKYTSNWWLLQL